MSPRSKHLFYLEVGKLLGAGFGIRQAADTLLKMHPPAAQAQLLSRLKQGLEAGKSIADAAAAAGTLSPLEQSLIRAGERSGRLAPAFEHLADYFGLIANARRDVIRSLVYPVIVLHLGVFVATVPTALLAGKSLAAVAVNTAWALLGVYLVAAGFAWVFHRLMKAAPQSAPADRALHRLPWIGKARHHLALARFCKVYHAGLLAALPMSECARLAADATQSATLREAALRLAHQAERGEALGPHFLRESAFPDPFARSYATGEEAGTLDTDLARWADQFRDESQSATRVAAAILPKLLYFLILLFAAWKIAAFFNGYYSGIIDQLEE
jgi:type IV pilus assembly protein PilC